MGDGKPLAFVLILCMISALNANIMLPRKHLIDWATFQSEVLVSLIFMYSDSDLSIKEDYMLNELAFHYLLGGLMPSFDDLNQNIHLASL